jgi:flavodoxin-like protein
MKALVIYESMFGNTRTIASGVAAGLAQAQVPTDVCEVSEAPLEIGPDVDLVVLGGPTHAFGMSRPASREDAGKQCEDALVSPSTGQREWLERARIPRGLAVAAFDTRINKSWLPGSAARAADRRLRRLGGTALDRPQSFYVTGTQGPLEDGEQERAQRWGEHLGTLSVARSRATTG